MTPSPSRVADPVLLGLIEASRAGTPVPRLSVLSRGWLIHGTIGSVAEFRAETESDLRQVLDSQVRAAQPWNRATTSRAADDGLAAFTSAFNQAIPGIDECPTMTLLECTLAGGGLGGQLRVPALRLELTAVDSWWATRTKVEKGSGGTGGFLFGVDI